MSSLAADGPGSAVNPDLRKRRRSSAAAAAADTLLSTAQAIEHKLEETLLILWDELPHWRQDNVYIKGGYRRDSNSYWGSFISLFYIHNESVNIWSHLLGALLFPTLALWMYSVIAPRYASASRADVIMLSFFFIGEATCLVMSATYHALCNHSEQVAKWGNKLDYTGIVAAIVGSYVPALYYGLYCLPELLTIYMGAIFFLGTCCTIVSWVEMFRKPRFRTYRAMVFVGLGVSGVVPIAHGVMIYGWQGVNQRMGLHWCLLEGFFYIFGAFLYAVRWPERSAPGSFDIWGNSHQIFHVLIICAGASHFKGMEQAFDYHHTVMGAQC